MHVGNEINHYPNHCCLKTKSLQHAIAVNQKELIGSTTDWECSGVELGMMDAPDSGFFKIFVIQLNREPCSDKSKLLILKRLAWQVGATSSVAAWIGTELASLQGKTGRTQLRFKLNCPNIFAPVAFGGVCTCLWPNCKPKSGLPKRKENCWSRGRCFMMLLISYSLNCCPCKSIHTSLLLPLEVGLPKNVRSVISSGAAS